MRSHGWYDLPPFQWDSDAHRLTFVFLEGECPVQVVVAARASGLVATASSSSIPSRAAVRRALDRVFDLRADLSSFHSLCAGDPRFAWIARRGAGRILRAPTVFEDAVKVLATTNCTWGLTRIMVRRLIERFGRG